LWAPSGSIKSAILALSLALSPDTEVGERTASRALSGYTQRSTAPEWTSKSDKGRKINEFKKIVELERVFIKVGKVIG